VNGGIYHPSFPGGRLGIGSDGGKSQPEVSKCTDRKNYNCSKGTNDEVLH
jgi:hypothetical protein